MGLRCLLGHDFGEPELNREREEQGDEVIITVSEVKTCRRCGATQVVSENKEVTSIEQLTATAATAPPTADDAHATSQTTNNEPEPAETAFDESTPASSPAAETTASAANQPAEQAPASGITIDDEIPTTEDAEILTDEPANSAPDETASSPTAVADSTNLADTVDDADGDGAAGPADQPLVADTATADSSDPEPAAADDGIILPNEQSEAGEREPGEWPEYEEEPDAEDTPTPWPEQAGEDTGFDAESPLDERSDEITFGGGFTPEITDAEGAEPGVSALAADDDEMLFTRADDAPVYEPTVDDIATEFFCPECGFTRVSGNSSMRAGDICPECRKGYISEQPR